MIKNETFEVKKQCFFNYGFVLFSYTINFAWKIFLFQLSLFLRNYNTQMIYFLSKWLLIKHTICIYNKSSQITVAVIYSSANFCWWERK